MVADDATEEAAAKTALWQRIWKDRTVEIGVLGAMLLVLTGVFFFQFQATLNAAAFMRFRMIFLAFSLVFLGWYANAQLSVVNLMALAASLRSGFTWDAFLMDRWSLSSGSPCCGAAVLGAGCLLWLALPVWRLAGDYQPHRSAAFQNSAMDAALEPA